MYEKPAGLWRYGHWVNGGHWSTCEARMILAYSRLGAYEDARRSIRHLLTFARRFGMDNPLTEFGNDVYQPKLPVNLTYDALGPPAALIRGLFEYLYLGRGSGTETTHSTRRHRSGAARSRSFRDEEGVPERRGTWLTVDSRAGQLVGPHAVEANRLLKRDYRRPYVIPDTV